MIIHETHHDVTDANIEDVRASMAALDQADELVTGCETWGIQHEGGQRGQMTVWPETGRAALCLGSNSAWGDWDPDSRTMTVDNDGDIYNEDGDWVGPIES